MKKVKTFVPAVGATTTVQPAGIASLRAPAPPTPGAGGSGGAGTALGQKMSRYRVKKQRIVKGAKRREHSPRQFFSQSLLLFRNKKSNLVPLKRLKA